MSRLEPARTERVIAIQRRRPACGAWMPYAKERCARLPGHATEHRTAYSLDNLRVKRARERITA